MQEYCMIFSGKPSVDGVQQEVNRWLREESGSVHVVDRQVSAVTDPAGEVILTIVLFYKAAVCDPVGR